MNEISKQKVSILFYMILCLTVISCKQPSQSNSVIKEYNGLELKFEDRMLNSIYSATIRGKQDVEIRPQVSGIITKLLVTEGETVTNGQALFIIDQIPYIAALQTAEANVKVAEANVATAQLVFDSKKELFAQNIISLHDLQTANNNLKSQQATLSQAKAQEYNAKNNLSYTTVKSPSDGVVGTLPYRVGSLVNSSITIPLTTISDNSQMYIYFSMTENQVLELSRRYGSIKQAIDAMPEVGLRLNDGTIYAEKGKIETISGIIDASTGAVSIRAAFPNKERILLSGSSGNVIMPYERKNCIVIPQSATYETQDKIFVYKIVDGLTKSTEIKVFNITDGKEYIVEEGLNIADTIVAEGVGLMRNETPVKIKIID